MKKLFYPESIIVFGVSTSPNNLGKNIVENLIEFGFNGEIHAFGKKKGFIFGRKIITSYKDLPENIDLAAILTPAPLVPEILEVCGQKGITRIVIETGGFSEYSESGADLEKKCIDIANKYKMKFVGPNCIAIINLENGMVLPFMRLYKESAKLGDVSIAAQSGGMALTYLNFLSSENIGVNKIISMGNKAYLNEEDYLDYLSNDKGSKIIVLYLESIDNGRSFFKKLKKSNKPVIIHKANISNVSLKIAQSHTAAMLNDDEVVDAAINQAGAFRIRNLEELLIHTKSFILEPMKGKNLIILSRSGGHAVVSADAAYKFGFNLVDFSKDFIEDIKKHFRANVINPTNPLDLGDIFDFDAYMELLEKSLKREDVHGILFNHTYMSGPESQPSLHLFNKIKEFSKKYKKPISLCILTDWHELLKLKEILDYPFFTEPEDAIKALDISYKFYNEINLHTQDLTLNFDFNNLSISETPNLYDALNIINQIGIKIPKMKIISSPEEVEKEFKFPVVLKAISSKFTHKTDIGGVILNINTFDELKTSFEKIKSLKNVEKILIQEMIENKFELIIGGKIDKSFGPIIMVGAGGIFAESLQDKSIAIAPLLPEEVEKYLLKKLKIYPILKGARGFLNINLKELKKIISTLSFFFYKFQNKIKEFEINPLILNDKGIYAVDCRIF